MECEWPGDELNRIYGALLDTLEVVEEELHRGLRRVPDPPPSTRFGGNERWLHKGYHGLGKAPRNDLRSPTEDIMSEDSPASHRRRRMHGACCDRHVPV